jgi:1-acyl-sn-glycerol-3-phosphate acyltransferase
VGDDASPTSYVSAGHSGSDDPLTPTLSPKGARGKGEPGNPLTPAVSVVRATQQWKPGPLYGPIRALCIAVKASLMRAHVSGLEHMPRSGGLLLVSNHISLADPVILMAVSPRPLVFMAKEELYRPSVARLILHLWGGSFSVRRDGTDVRAVREALALLDAGAPVVVFPEGTRQRHGLGHGHRGVGYLAARAGKPVVPVGIVGTEKITGLWDLRRLPTFEVRVGEAFSVSPDEQDDVTDTIMRRIAALLPLERRGAYADTERVNAL